MASESTEKTTCEGCGAVLGPQMRFCVNCYRPAARGSHARAHVETASQVDTTRRVDPTVVFLPEVHEARARRSRRRRRSATVALVLVILAGALLTVWLAQGRRGRERRSSVARSEMARRELNSMAEALERFREDVGRYPTASEGLGGLMRRPAAFKPTDDRRLNQWFGPYLESLPEVDPWGNDYVYETTEGAQGFRVYSHGPEGEGSAEADLQVSSADVR